MSKNIIIRLLHTILFQNIWQDQYKKIEFILKNIYLLIVRITWEVENLKNLYINCEHIITIQRILKLNQTSFGNVNGRT